MAKTEAPTMRAFIACNLDVESVRRFERVARVLRETPNAPSARWVPPTRMHLTLKFLGDVDVGLTPALRDALEPIARSARAFRLEIAGLTAFPDAKDARVVVLSLRDDAGSLDELVQEVEAAAETLGFEKEARPYHAHVTLARLGRPTNVDVWCRDVAVPREPARVTELVLYRSDFATPHTEYAALARFAIPT